MLPVKTAQGLIKQSLSPAALAARERVANGATLYKLGTTRISAAPESQYWSLENPLTPSGAVKADFAQRHGIPQANVAAQNFVQRANLKPGAHFVTNEAPAVGSNSGGAIEVVVPEGAVVLGTFVYIEGKEP